MKIVENRVRPSDSRRLTSPGRRAGIVLAARCSTWRRVERCGAVGCSNPSFRDQRLRLLQGRAGSTPAFSHLISRSISSRSEFCKRLRNAGKQPDQNGMGLQNRVRDFNDLARKPLCYRYTIPQWIIKQFQCVVVIRCVARRNWPAAARAVLLAPSRAWQACCDGRRAHGKSRRARSTVSGTSGAASS